MGYYNPTSEESQVRREALQEFDDWNSRVFLGVLATFGLPHSYLDLGCGSGIMAKLADGMGVDTLGVDVTALDSHPFHRHDLRQPLHLNRTFDLITCIEVVEHIDEEYADTLCDTMAEHLAHRGTLVLTAALPGQPGDHHVNCQPPVYWRGKLFDRGISYSSDMTLKLTATWALVSGPLMHLPANLQVFTR